ncbi:hypothetical protein H0H10_21140 [Streptomyces sp. TRM S81-3]|uniref:Uncharacterized protein n=1 Tax=Streptomyces griseicoloratus TaxID=2752516 RepID=A0A926L467_9ACTN|nr:hypothetical protein [Streptomyces griseicoloratus]MBD0421625.1 hypothetical protein [Streptomyces griseicoloratus]
MPSPEPPASPVSVTVGAVEHSIDVIRPQLRTRGARRVALYAGVQINGAPHVGTNVMQTAAFLLARAARDRLGVEAGLRFGALDNAPYESRTCPRTGTRYERSYHHALGPDRVGNLVKRFYGDLFDALSSATGVRYTVDTYTAQQQLPAFREEFLTSLAHWERLRWVLAPGSGHVPISFPCPQCGWLQKYGENTRLLQAGPTAARFTAVCLDHGRYDTEVRPDGGAYVGLTTLHRNLVKERAADRDDAMPVIIKGADWAAGCRLLDEAFLCFPGAVPPPRVFTPVILSESGAKLSKSLMREGKAQLTPDTAPWMLDATAWEGTVGTYAAMLRGLVSLMLTEPRHFERGYTTAELGRLVRTHGLMG